MDKTAIKQTAIDLARKPVVKRIAIGLTAFLVLFGLIGYFALPGIIKSKTEQIIADKLHRKVSIERIDVSPYRLAVNIHKLKMLEPDGSTTFVSFDELEVNLSLQSLFRLAPVAEELRLVRPYVHLTRTGKNRYSIDDILEELGKQPPSKEPARFSVYNIQIDGGQLDFNDQPENTQHTITDLKLGIPFISSLPSKIDIFVEPLLSAKVNGAPMQIKGKARPFGEEKEISVDLDLEGISLPHYLEYLPFEPRFKVPQGTLDLQLNASFQQKPAEAPALMLKGTASLKNLLLTETDGKPMIRLQELALTLDETNPVSGNINVSRLALTHPELNVIKERNGNLNLMRLSPPPVAQTDSAGASSKTAESSTQSAIRVALGEFAIIGGSVKFDDQQLARPFSASVEKFDLLLKKAAIDLQKKEASVAEIHSNSAAIQMRHGKRGAASARSGTSSPEKSGNAPGIAFSIGKLAVANWSARIEDQNLKQAAITQIAPLSLSLDDLSSTVGSKGKLDMKATVNQNGQLAINGVIGLAPLHANLTLNLKEVDVLPAQPYFTEQVNLLLTRANVSAQGSLQVELDGKGELKGGYKGKVALGSVATVDKISANDFTRWKNLSIDGIDLKLAPLSLSIDQIAINDFFARLIIDQQGRINLRHIIRGEMEEATSLTEAPAQSGNSADKAAKATLPTTPATSAPVKKMPPIKIKKLTMRGGKVRFSDYYIKPNYTANMVNLGGAITGLSSDAKSTANVDLRGQVNSAPLTINGKVNPLKGELFLDLKAEIKGMELAPLSAYSGKYVGYGIEKGKLSFDVAYKVENRQLTAENRLVLDQLTFGEKVESKEALNLPVQLAVALLRDRNGVIDLKLPIGGSLDDPEFSIGSIIVKMFVNLIGKAVTAPFALLGSMFGGGEDLSWVNFDSGSAAINASAETRLTGLSKALIDRPALKLEITGRADPETDQEGLARASIARKVRALKIKDMVAKGQSVPPGRIEISKEEYPALLKRAYGEEKFSKPRNLVGLAKSLPVAEMEKLMAANAKITDGDLIELGNRRAQAIKDWLVAKEVPTDRVFIIASKLSDGKDKQGPNRADFSLR